MGIGQSSEPTDPRSSMDEAIALVTAAVDADHASNYQRAFELYERALSKFVPLLSSDAIPAAEKATLQPTVEGYLERAEVLKQHLRAGGVVTTPRGAPAPPPKPTPRKTPTPRLAPAPAPAPAPAAARSSGKETFGDISSGRRTSTGRGRGRTGTTGAAGRGSTKGTGRTTGRTTGGASRGRSTFGTGRSTGTGGRGRGTRTGRSRSPARRRGAGAGSGRGSAPAKGGRTPSEPLTDLEKDVMEEVIDSKLNVKWDDIAGLAFAKDQLKEAVILPNLRPDIYTGLRAPPKGILLFGPPGTGKTMLAKAVASQSDATFISLSASALTSKWVGEGEKRVKAVFSLAQKLQPSVVFIDEIDSVLTKRSDNENESSRRLKTEFMVQVDGATTAGDVRVFVMGATNRPWELDDAVLRRLTKAVLIPLPDPDARRGLIQHLLKDEKCALSSRDYDRIVRLSDKYSGSELKDLCREAAQQPVRRLGAGVMSASVADVDPIKLVDFETAFRVVRAKTSPEELRRTMEWGRAYGSTG